MEKSVFSAGASLYAVGETGQRRQFEAECFGIPLSGAIIGIAIGVAILLWGFIGVLRYAYQGSSPLTSRLGR